MLRITKLVSTAIVALPLLLGTGFAQRGGGGAGGAVDPGVQGGNRGTGATLIPQNDPTGYLAFFNDGLRRFQDVESVSNSPTGNNGLGPRFNSNQCSSCHAQPAVGGSGTATNPQAQFTSNGTAPIDSTPFFVTPNGPTLEARFPFFFNRDGSANLNAPNGGVEDLFTVSGRPDAGNCNLSQPTFQAAAAANNLIFRIPTPTFGLGLIENLDDSTLLSNQHANLNNNFGISGTFNHNGNDGTISRFGWKAQNKSLQIFAGEAYNVEMGISNELFPQDRPLPGEDGNGNSGQTGLPASCLNLTGTGYPEDTFNPTQNPQAAVLDDVSAFANFIRFLSPPPPGPVVLNGNPVAASSISNGAALFAAIGCGTCHNASPGTTQVSNFASTLSNQSVPAFSDLEIHHMGGRLADNVGQGSAGGDQFRTAPLWGLGQRIFLLHDGRTTDLRRAIREHGSNGSEAFQVEDNFSNLDSAQQQDLLNFLRSL